MAHIRAALSASLPAAGLAFGLSIAAPTSAHDELTIVTWGGAYTRSQVLAYFRPYRERTDVHIDIEHYNGGIAAIREQVASLNIEWDVVDLTLADTLRACEEGLLEKIDHSTLPPAPDGTPASEDFIEGTLVPCGIGQILWSTVIAYDESRFGTDPPASVADFWDRSRFPGRRGMRKVPQKNLEWALIADGVPRERVYEVLGTEEGIDRAFRSLDRIKPALVWWENGAEPPQLLAQGVVSMSTAWNGRIYDAVHTGGMRLGIVWTDSLWDIDLWGIVKHTTKRDMAMEFIEFATSTEPLAAQAKHIAYGPARKSAIPLVDAAVEPYLPTAPENFESAFRFDSEWWAANQQRLDARFRAWLEEPNAKPEQLPR